MNSIKQTAHKLSVSEKTVRALVNNGSIEHHRIGVGRGTIRISDQAIEAYLQSTKVHPDDQTRRRRLPRHSLKHIKL